jgi:predicted dehydrogenase
MIHDLDLALDIVGEKPTALSVSGLTAFSGSVDHAVANLRFSGGPLLTVTASRLTEQKVRQIEVTALDAYVLVDLLNKSIAVHRSTVGEYVSNNGRGVKYRQEGMVERIHVPTAEPLFLELQHFVECVRCGRPSLVPARHGLRALCLATSIRDAGLENILDVHRVHGVNALVTELPAPAMSVGP